MNKITCPHCLINQEFSDILSYLEPKLGSQGIDVETACIYCNQVFFLEVSMFLTIDVSKEKPL